MPRLTVQHGPPGAPEVPDGRDALLKCCCRDRRSTCSRSAPDQPASSAKGWLHRHDQAAVHEDLGATGQEPRAVEGVPGAHYEPRAQITGPLPLAGVRSTPVCYSSYLKWVRVRVALRDSVVLG